MLGKEVIVDFCEARNVTHLFHLPGIHTLPLNDVLGRSSLNVIIGRHESNIGFMADGYARATHDAGVVLVTPGPGLGNVVTACMEAFGADIPLVVLFVDVERKDIEKGVLHGVARPESLFGTISKGTFVVAEPKDLRATLEGAYRTAVTPRTGPVIVSIPYRMLEQKCPATYPPAAGPAGGAASIDPEPFVQALAGKQRPVIIGGGAVMDEETGAIIDRICRESRIPFLSTTSGKGLLREDRDYAFGNVIAKGVAQEIMRSADLTIALGTRLRDSDAKRRGVKVTSLVHADVDGRWLGRNFRTDSAVAGDMRKTAAALAAAIGTKRFSWDMEGLHESRTRERSAWRGEQTGLRIVELLRRCVPENAVTVWDLNMVGYWAEYYFPVLRQRTFLTPRGMSPIFYAFPAAIGAKLGRPDVPCLCVTGDASFVATAAELATVRQYNIPVVILVYNNTAFGVLEDYMKKRYDRSGSMNLPAPDFLTLARAFDIRAARAQTVEELEQIFCNDVTWNEPFLIEFRFPVFPPPWD